jgi:hypothetical protein
MNQNNKIIVFQKKKPLRPNLWLEALKNKLADAKLVLSFEVQGTDAHILLYRDSGSPAVEQARKLM